MQEMLLSRALKSIRINFRLLDSYVNVSNELGLRDDLRAEHEAILDEKEDFRSRYILGKLAFLEDDYEMAAEQFDQGVRIDPSKRLVWFNYGYALRKLSRPDESIEKYL